MSDKKTTGIDWVFEWQKEDSVAIRAAGFVYRGSPDMGFADGLNAAKLHIEDAMQAFIDGELLEELIG